MCFGERKKKSRSPSSNALETRLIKPWQMCTKAAKTPQDITWPLHRPAHTTVLLPSTPGQSSRASDSQSQHSRSELEGSYTVSKRPTSNGGSSTRSRSTTPCPPSATHTDSPLLPPKAFSAFPIAPPTPPPGRPLPNPPPGHAPWADENASKPLPKEPGKVLTRPVSFHSHITISRKPVHMPVRASSSASIKSPTGTTMSSSTTPISPFSRPPNPEPPTPDVKAYVRSWAYTLDSSNAPLSPPMTPYEAEEEDEGSIMSPTAANSSPPPPRTSSKSQYERNSRPGTTYEPSLGTTVTLPSPGPRPTSTPLSPTSTNRDRWRRNWRNTGTTTMTTTTTTTTATGSSDATIPPFPEPPFPEPPMPTTGRPSTSCSDAHTHTLTTTTSNVTAGSTTNLLSPTATHTPTTSTDRAPSAAGTATSSYTNTTTTNTNTARRASTSTSATMTTTTTTTTATATEKPREVETIMYVQGGLPTFPSLHEAKKARKAHLKREAAKAKLEAKMGVEGLLSWDPAKKTWVCKLKSEEEKRAWVEGILGQGEGGEEVMRCLAAK